MGQSYPRGAKFGDPLVFGAVPAGFYSVTLPLMAEGRTKAEDKLKYDSSTGFHINAVKKITDKRYLDDKWGGDEGALVGMSIFAGNDFIVGLLDQPGPVDAGGQLADPDDWLKSPGGKLFNNMLESSMVDATDDADENCALMEGREVVVQVRVERDQTETYPDKNRIVKFFPIEAERSAPRASAPARPAPLARPASAAAARPAPAPARPAAVARPAAAPARPAAPARAAISNPVTCDVCESEGKTAEESVVERSQFAKHLREVHPESA